MSNETLLRKFWEALGLPITELEHVEMMDVFSAGDKAGELYPNVHETLSVLAGRGVRMGLIRNSHMPESVMRKKLAKLGLNHFFDVVVMSGEEGHEKPAPEIFHAAIRKAGLDSAPPATIAFVGNEAAVDIVGANAMGWRSLLVCNTEPSSAGLATHDIPAIEHLVHLLPPDNKTIIKQADL